MGSKQPLEGSFREIVKTHRPRKIDLGFGQHLKEQDRQEEPGNCTFPHSDSGRLNRNLADDSSDCAGGGNSGKEKYVILSKR